MDSRKIVNYASFVVILGLIFSFIYGCKEQKKSVNVPKEEVRKDIKTNENETNKNKYYSVTDELVCGKVSIKSIATCPYEHNRPLWQLRCDQKIFINKKLLSIKGGLSVYWGCVKDRKTSKYCIVIDFYSGGNCWDCEWTGVWDLEGNLIMDTRMDRTKCTLPRRRERTPEGFFDEFATCPEELIKKREENIKYINELKQGNEKNFKVVNFEKENQSKQ